MREWIIQAETIGKISDGYWYSNGEEIVRCKDCTEFSDDDEEDGWGFCNNTGVGMERDGFCSCGERKDDAE